MNMKLLRIFKAYRELEDRKIKLGKLYYQVLAESSSILRKKSEYEEKFYKAIKENDKLKENINDLKNKQRYETT